MTKCVNTACDNDVPVGHEGGYCPGCCAEIEALSIAEEHPEIDDRPWHEILGMDPYEEYGFDHPWER